jgi:hypothetical protein
MYLIRILIALFALSGLALPAQAVSTAPLQIINAYIESNGNCSETVVDWNRKYNPRAVSGDVQRIFYYRVLAYIDWGNCGRPYFKRIFSELQKVWIIYDRQLASDSEIESKESELINLLFAALRAGELGVTLVDRYEQRIAAHLMTLPQDRQYFNCTMFGDSPRCMD